MHQLLSLLLIFFFRPLGRSDQTEPLLFLYGSAWIVPLLLFSSFFDPWAGLPDWVPPFSFFPARRCFLTFATEHRVLLGQPSASCSQLVLVVMPHPLTLDQRSLGMFLYSSIGLCLLLHQS